VLVGVMMGVSVTALAALMMGQGASQPVKASTEYFVTGEDEHAHLWVREGANLRVVGHGECTKCPFEGHDHEHGDGHDHGKEAPKK
jgi:hypothetical protein